MKKKKPTVTPMRLTWNIKPVTKVVGSKKAYDRNREKSNVRRELG